MIGGNLVMAESVFLIPTDEIRIPVAYREIWLNLKYLLWVLLVKMGILML